MLESSGAEQKTGSKKVHSILWAIVIHVVLIVIFTIVVILPAIREEPEIVAEVVSPGPKVDPKKQKRSVTKQVEKSSAASAASPIARLMRANATAVIAAPEVKKVSDGPVGLGEGDFGDGGFGSGSGGLGSGASFFGARSTAKRVLFVLDYSLSMKKNQRSMLESEMEKSLKALDSRIKYQVAQFAGPVWYPGWAVNGNRKNPTIVGEDGSFTFSSVRGASDFKFDGSPKEMPNTPWLSATEDTVSKTMAELRKTKQIWGTDWGMAFEVAFAMVPPPDLIFFMADGTGGNSPPPILELCKLNGNPKVNMFAMQTNAGAREFQEIAKGTGAEFRIIISAEETIKGDDYFKDKSKYDPLIKKAK